jgi:hypothetical protein
MLQTMPLETKSTKYGKVFRLEGGCKDDWDNIVTARYYRKPSGLIRRRLRRVPITMQKPAIEALRVAEAALAREIVVTGSLRTCELQAKLYASDRARFAPNTVGLHCQGLAIDVSTNDPELKTKVRKALLAVGFTQTRVDDEPWHFSYGWTA